MAERVIEVKNLKTSFFTHKGTVQAVNDVSYYVDKGEVVAIVGESGCGKSVTQMSVMQLVQSPPGKILGGEVILNGRDILKYDAKSPEMRAVRGAEIAMIFQEPMTSLNPIIKVGKQLQEVIGLHRKVSKEEAWEIGTKSLEAVGIPDPAERMNCYPFELSGGMRQRAMIAMAAACRPSLIVADEPTTALDVTTQAQVMELLMKFVKEDGTSLIVVTHNLGLVTRYADRIYVMYAGKIVESGTCADIIKHPKHPYTIGLLKSVPTIDGSKDEKLVPIQGTPPDLSELPNYCSFAERCTMCCEKCTSSGIPELKLVGPNEHYSACHVLGEEEGKDE